MNNKTNEQNYAFGYKIETHVFFYFESVTVSVTELAYLRISSRSSVKEKQNSHQPYAISTKKYENCAQTKPRLASFSNKKCLPVLNICIAKENWPSFFF